MHVNMPTKWKWLTEAAAVAAASRLSFTRAAGRSDGGGASAVDAPVKGHLLLLLLLGSMQANIQSDTNPSFLLHVSVFHSG